MLTRSIAAIGIGAVLAIGTCCVADDFEQEKYRNWHQFHGPDGNGVARNAQPPSKWGPEKNVKWKTEIPGRGSSSPIVWGNRVFLMTAIETDRVAESAESQPAEEEQAERTERGGNRAGQGGRRGGRRGFRRPPPSNYYEFAVLCVNRESGDILWKTIVNEAVPHEGGHPTNTFASGTPTTNGEHLYVNFGSFGVYCLDMDGEIQWKRDLGKMQTRNSFGEGASAAIYGDTLVVPWDHEGESFIAALDAATGETKWTVDRDERTTWATPLIVEHSGTTQVITNGYNKVRSYDMKSGKLIWECGGQVQNPIPTPMLFDGHVICMTGYQGNSIMSISLDSRGDVTDGREVAWSRRDAAPYVPTGVLYDDTVYHTKSLQGVFRSLDAKTGEPVIEQTRLPDIEQVYASLVAADDKIFVTGRDGTTVVVKHGPELEVLATNAVGEAVDATPALVDNQILIRGEQHLFCIENGE